MQKQIITLLERATERRASFFKSDSTNAFRLFSGESEGLGGLNVDRYDSVLLFQVFEGKCKLSRGELVSIGEWYCKSLAVRSVYLKYYVSDRSHLNVEKHPALYSSLPLVGEVAPANIVVRENGVAFTMKPYDGFSTGIFLDQRENRKFLAERSAGKRVLNGFSYTCAFSVCCALAGASVTSIDISKKHLEWGEENFILNSLNLEKHRFVVSDIFAFLKKAIRKGDKFDLVILDPPSFSRNKEGKVFSIQRDFSRLLASGFALLAPTGELFFSTNYAPWTTGVIKAMAEKVTGKHGRLRYDKLPPAGKDFGASKSISAFLLKRG